MDISSENKIQSFIWAGVLLIVFVAGYFLIRQFGLFEILSGLSERRLSYGLIFLVGLLASFHCVGMCGGFVVAYTTKCQTGVGKGGLAHFKYNAGRLISYSAIGAALGGFGSFFGINPVFTGAVTTAAGLLMALMGLSLLTDFRWLKKIQVRTPIFIARFLYGKQDSSRSWGPFAVGLANGFMPCGPLQAMQVYALASGSIVNGALSMGVYALGTAPLMFGLGTFVSLMSQERIGQAMKFSGAVVVLLGVLMFNRGLISFGYDFRHFFIRPADQAAEEKGAFDSASAEGESRPAGRQDGPVADEYQAVNMDLTYWGYSPNVLYIKKGVPVRWIINAKEISGCTNEIIMPEYNIRRNLVRGENVIEFTPGKAGEIKFSCWMQMVWGKFIVTEN